MGKKVIQNSKEFFALRDKLEKILLDIEATHYSNVGLIYQFEVSLQEMLQIANESHALYFSERLKSIQTKFKDMQKNKFKNQIELKRIYSLINKLDENEKSVFLSKLLNVKLDQIVRKSLEEDDKILTTTPSFEKYLVLQFQSSIFFVPNLKKKIVKNVSYSTKYLSLNGKKFPIFPLHPLKIEIPEEKDEASKLLVLRLLDGYRCIRYDSLICEEEFNEIELKERQIETNSIYEDLKYLIRWRGRNCFFLDFSKKSFIENF